MSYPIRREQGRGKGQGETHSVPDFNMNAAEDKLVMVPSITLLIVVIKYNKSWHVETYSSTVLYKNNTCVCAI